MMQSLQALPKPTLAGGGAVTASFRRLGVADSLDEIWHVREERIAALGDV